MVRNGTVLLQCIYQGIAGRGSGRHERLYEPHLLKCIQSLYDVMLEPRDRNKDAFLLEFKVYNPRREKSLEETVAAARAQIEEKQYAAQLTEKGIPKERIHIYGLAFRGKEVLIG